MIHHAPKNILRLGLVLTVTVFTLASCSVPRTANPNIAVQHPLKVRIAMISMAVRLSSPGGAVTASSAIRLQGFVREYYRRAQGPMIVASAPGSTDITARSSVEAVRARLIRAGVRETEIIIKPGIAPIDRDDVVVVSFRGAKVKLPECGDWSGSTSFDPSNSAHTNFGCSYQRNIGLMVSNPQDLVRSGPVGDPDSARQTIFLRNYRGEEEVSVEKTETEDTGLGN